MARPDLSDIDENLKTLGPLPKDLDRLLEAQLGCVRLAARRADELLAALTVSPQPSAAEGAEPEDEEAVVIDIDPDDDD